MAEPTKEELMAKIADLERQVGAKKTGVQGRRKGRRQCIRAGPLPGHVVLRAVDQAA